MSKGYEQFLAENDLTEAQVREVLGWIWVDDAALRAVRVAPSEIQGMGTFSEWDIDPGQPGEIIAPLRMNDNWTLAGRYTNHSDEPNTAARGNLLVAIKPIKAGEEFTADYRQVKREMEAVAL